MTKLILTRHGQSIWNAKNKFTGWVDIPLSERGRAEATIASCKLKDYRVRVCFTSMLFRAMETAVIILTEIDDICGGRTPIVKYDIEKDAWKGWDQYDGDPEDELPVYPTATLDERHYGELQGLDKAETVAEFGKEQVQLWRRSYAVRPPGGESLEDTVKRTTPFFRDHIMKHVIEGDDVLIVAHGNSLRSLIKRLENLSEEEIVKVELGTAVPIVYDIDSQGQVTDKIILN